MEHADRARRLLRRAAIQRLPGSSRHPPRRSTGRLRSLVAAGVLHKEIYQQSPVRYGYGLTDAGRELLAADLRMARWGERHASDGGPRTIFSHVSCRTRLDVVGGCPACGVQVSPEDVMMRPGPGALTSCARTRCRVRSAVPTGC